MYIEHLIYSAALAIIIGMAFLRYTGRDQSWIIIFASIVPDTDYLFKIGCEFFSPLPSPTFMHGDFHAIPGLIFFSFFIALFFSNAGIKFKHALFFSVVGYSSHLIEDFIVHPPYFNRYLYPFDTTLYGTKILSDVPDLVIANSGTLLIGVMVLCAAIIVRTRIEPGWSVKKYVGNGVTACQKSIKRLMEGNE